MQDTSIYHIFKHIQTHDCCITYSYYFHFCKNSVVWIQIHYINSLQETYFQISCENKVANNLYDSLPKENIFFALVPLVVNAYVCYVFFYEYLQLKLFACFYKTRTKKYVFLSSCSFIPLTGPPTKL